MNTAQLMWGMAFGSVGLGYFVYGKKQRAVVPLLCGGKFTENDRALRHVALEFLFFRLPDWLL